MTALRPERESGAAYGESFTDGSGYGTAGQQGTSYGQPYEASGALGDGWYGGPADGVPGGATDGFPGGSAGGLPGGAPDGFPGGPSDSLRGDFAGEPGGVTGAASDGGAYPPPIDEETVALRIPDPPERITGGEPPSPSAAASGAGTAGTTPGGRAARRKAAKGRHGRHGGSRRAAEGAETPESAQDGPRAPLSRVEARRQARARKPGPAVVASRVIGEVFITTGVLMLLFVSYQLWWTNVRAHAQAGKEASSLQDGWASGKRNPGVFAPGQGFAILHIPKLDVVVPIAEGTSSKGVLDRGMVGHYAEGALKTAMPDAKTGNFGLAGHRNTHGEPFRYINRLKPGDPIVVETQDTYFVYKMASILPVTSPSNVSVLDPIPKGSGFTAPGRYITLTTCTPEFTSKYRMIVWGKMVEERPRSKGKPDALVS